MSERLVELDVPFSIADTEGRASIAFADAKLSLTFRDWQLVEHSVSFVEVVAFRWDNNYLSSCEVAPDRVYEVHDSAWMSALRESGAIGSTTQHRHFRFYFNSEGAALDVIASSSSPLLRLRGR